MFGKALTALDDIDDDKGYVHTGGLSCFVLQKKIFQIKMKMGNLSLVQHFKIILLCLHFFRELNNHILYEIRSNCNY